MMQRLMGVPPLSEAKALEADLNKKWAILLATAGTQRDAQGRRPR